SPSARLRKFCDLHVVRRVIPLTFSFFLIVESRILIFMGTGPLNNVCGPQSALFYQILSCFLLIFFAIIPPLMMTIFGLLTIWNIKQNHQRVMPRYCHHRGDDE
ncbi:unnamed protein product, partial [Didymodactylos carnosus]